MKSALISAVVAVVVSLIVLGIAAGFDDDDDGVDATPAPLAAAPSVSAPVLPPGLSVSIEPTEDSWVDGARSSGADDRMLTDAASSVCFLTKVEISGSAGPDDVGTCRVEVDDFTGFWKVTADVPEGSRSEIRCNARCLVWEQEGA